MNAILVEKLHIKILPQQHKKYHVKLYRLENIVTFLLQMASGIESDQEKNIRVKNILSL